MVGWKGGKEEGIHQDAKIVDLQETNHKDPS